MKTFVMLAGLLLASGLAQATCYGTGAFRTCNDSSGNSETLPTSKGPQTVILGIKLSQPCQA
jgi:hypothetical protein